MVNEAGSGCGEFRRLLPSNCLELCRQFLVWAWGRLKGTLMARCGSQDDSEETGSHIYF